MTHVTCRLTTKNRDQLRNSTLGTRVWATFTFLVGKEGNCLKLFVLLKRCPEICIWRTGTVVILSHYNNRLQ